jgi:cell division protease FtsH
MGSLFISYRIMAEREIGKMNNFSDIIGYEDVKNQLRRLADMCRNPSKYSSFGVTLPRGILLAGVPGVGKTTIAYDFIKETGFKSYVIRKDDSKDRFISNMKQTFEEACKNQPSVILLDDIDKFSSDSQNNQSEEYVLIQTLIDNAKNNQVFVIATANNIDYLPRSLLRKGRLDTSIHITTPTYEDSKLIINHYLSNKKVAKNLDMESIAMLMKDRSCAFLEGIMNEAGIASAYEGRKEIVLDDIVKAVINSQIDESERISDSSSASTLNTAYHEAGHLAAGLLGGVCDMVLAVLIKGPESNSGFVNFNSKLDAVNSLEDEEKIVYGYLAGGAAVEIQYGRTDIGSASDFEKAYGYTKNIIGTNRLYGISNILISSDYSDKNEDVKDYTRIKLEESYATTKYLLKKNWALVEMLTQALMKKKYLVYNEINSIYKQYLDTKTTVSNPS